MEQLMFSSPVAATYEQNRKQHLPYGKQVTVRFDFTSKTWVVVNDENEVLWSSPELILKDVTFVSREKDEEDPDAGEEFFYGCGDYGYGYNGKAEGTLVKEIPENPANPFKRWAAKFFPKWGQFTTDPSLSSCSANSGVISGARYLILQKDGKAQTIGRIGYYQTLSDV